MCVCEFDVGVVAMPFLFDTELGLCVCAYVCVGVRGCVRSVAFG